MSIKFQNDELKIDRQADAYVVVFSVHNRESFIIAEELIYHLRNEIDSDRPIILVANRIDLVRRRHVQYKCVWCYPDIYRTQVNIRI